MTRLLALLLSLALMASVAMPGAGVSRCEAMGSAVGCCPQQTPIDLTSCCCLEEPTPVPAALPTIDRHWLVAERELPLTASIMTLWSHSPTDAPTSTWRPSPVLPFGGGLPPRERFCNILN